MLGNSPLTVLFDPKVYCLTAVKKAAYRIGDRASSQIEILPDGNIQVVLTAKDRLPLSGDLLSDFRDEVLDQDLRETIGAETAQIRNILLAQAFSGVSLTDQVGETAEFESDPLNIGRNKGGDSRA